MKYRKLPIEVEAWPVGDLVSAYYNETLPYQVKNALNKGVVIFSANSIHVTTLEGEHIAKINDVLVEGIRGEFYGVNSAIFSDTYEKV